MKKILYKVLLCITVEKHFYVYIPWVRINKSIGTIGDSTL